MPVVPVVPVVPIIKLSLLLPPVAIARTPSKAAARLIVPTDRPAPRAPNATVAPGRAEVTSAANCGLAANAAACVLSIVPGLNACACIGMLTVATPKETETNKTLKDNLDMFFTFS